MRAIINFRAGVRFPPTALESLNAFEKGLVFNSIYHLATSAAFLYITCTKLVRFCC